MYEENSIINHKNILLIWINLAYLVQMLSTSILNQIVILVKYVWARY